MSRKLDDTDLLIRYMARVIACEGISFLDHGHGPEFTKIERDRLGVIEAEARDHLRNIEGGFYKPKDQH